MAGNDDGPRGPKNGGDETDDESEKSRVAFARFDQKFAHHTPGTNPYHEGGYSSNNAATDIILNHTANDTPPRLKEHPNFYEDKRGTMKVRPVLKKILNTNAQNPATSLVNEFHDEPANRNNPKRRR